MLHCHHVQILITQVFILPPMSLNGLSFLLTALYDRFKCAQSMINRVYSSMYYQALTLFVDQNEFKTENLRKDKFSHQAGLAIDIFISE